MSYTKPLSNEPDQRYVKIDGVELPVEINPLTGEESLQE